MDNVKQTVLNINVFYKKRIKIQIIRPLLTLNRFEVLKLCIFWRLPIYIDSTNKLINFRRNRLRYQILPILKIFFNPKIDVALTRFIKIVNSENKYFDQQLKDIKNFFQIQKENFKNLNQIRNPKWAIYLPYTLQQKLYKQLLIFYFKSLTFNEIEFLLRSNVLILK